MDQGQPIQELLCKAKKVLTCSIVMMDLCGAEPFTSQLMQATVAIAMPTRMAATR